MMYVTIIHENGKTYQMPVSQVVVHTANGDPCAISFERQGMIVHTNSAMKDFHSMLADLHIQSVKVPEAQSSQGG